MSMFTNSFFSFLVDGQHNFYYFSHDQRLSGVKFKNGTSPNYDYHVDIAQFYGITENDCNKFIYNPFNDKLTLIQQDLEENEEDNKEGREAEESKAEALSFVHSINWKDFCRDIEGARKFIGGLKDIKFMRNNPDFDLSGCRVFDTLITAYNAAYPAEYKPIYNIVLNATYDTAKKIAFGAARGELWKPAMEAAYNAAVDIIYKSPYKALRFAANDIDLYCAIHYLCADLPIHQVYIDYINKRYSLWLNGYGVLCDIDSTLYVFRAV